ncbi:MAG: c-type cytochrome [Myxococcales bacterium]|nr:c-type cytochrome [Myxococcales bacterium]MCB9576210.1 c-type cytochrome [Polyangiaceae bacterium]
MQAIRLAVIVAAALVAATASAEGDPMAIGKTLMEKGNAKGATPCMTCHAADGAGTPGGVFPRVAGQRADYLERQLSDFASGKRDNALMKPIVAALSPSERSAAAAYFASLSGPSTAKAEPKLVARGEKIARFGLWGRDVPACESCHGPEGRGIGTHFPPLAAQHPGYVEAQFKAFKDGTRKNDALALMQGIAKRMSDDDVKAVAAYFASLPAAPAEEKKP